MTRLLLALVAALGVGFYVASPAAAQTQADVDCDEIATDADAQAILAAFEGDPFDLDRNNDGNACDAGVGGGPVTFESFVGTPATAVPTEAPAAPTTAPEAPAATEAPAAPAATQAPATGGTGTGMTLPDTGAGVMAGGTSSTMAAVLAALAVVSAGVAASMRTRRA